MIHKNFVQKALVFTACSFSLIASCSFASDSVNQDIATVEKKSPVSPIHPSASLPPVDENVNAAGISVASVKENEDKNGNVTVGIGARGTEILDTTVNTKNPVVKPN